MSRENLGSKTVSGIMWKGLERVAAQLVSVVVGIVLARVLTPEDYSVVSIVAIFFAFCNVIISGGLNTALIQKKDADVLDYSTILITNIILAFVLYFIMFFFAPFIAGLYRKELLKPVIRVMSVMFFINGIKAVLSAKITSDLEFRKFFYSTIIGTVISAFVGIGMAINGFGPWALVAQQMTNSTIDMIILAFTANAKFRFSYSIRRLKALFSFGGRIMASALVNEIYNQLKPIIVGIRFSAVDLAFYNKGKTYPNLITSTGNDTLSSALFPVMAKVQNDKEAILLMTRRFMQLSSFVVFPTMFGLFAVSEGFVKIVLTDKWLPIVPFIMVFCISDMFKPIQTGNLQAIRAIGRADIFLKLEIIKKTTYLVVIALFIIFTNSPLMLAVSGIVTSIFASLINTYPNKKLIGYSYRMQFSDLSLNFLLSFVMGTIVFCVKFIPFNVYIITLLQIVVGVALYFGLNILVKNPNYYYFKSIVMARLRRNG